MKSRFNEPLITYGQMNFLFTVRNLWRDQATWTRAYLTGRYSGIGIADAAFERLYRVPQEFGNIMQYILGYDNALMYIQLLSHQVVLIRSLIDASIAGDTNLADQLVRQLYQLADERSRYTNAINPFWDETETKNLIYTYLQLTIEEITTLLAGEYTRNIDIFDRLLHHADNMGSFFTQGILSYMIYGRQGADVMGPIGKAE